MSYLVLSDSRHIRCAALENSGSVTGNSLNNGRCICRTILGNRSCLQNQTAKQ